MYDEKKKNLIIIGFNKFLCAIQCICGIVSACKSSARTKKIEFGQIVCADMSNEQLIKINKKKNVTKFNKERLLIWHELKDIVYRIDQKRTNLLSCFTFFFLKNSNQLAQFT